MSNVEFFGFLAVLAVCAPAAAQDFPSTRLFPGSVNLSSGTLSPTEAGNVISTTTVDQGVSVWRSGSLFVLGYASITQRNDTDGYVWNNNTPITLGARVAKTWASGVLQINLGVGIVANASTGPATAPVGYVSYWTGWRNTRTHPGRFALAFPGHAWASSGVVTPLEPGNWITNASAEEGITVWRARQFDIVPFAAVTVVRDTTGNSWNDKNVGDLGAKVQRFVPGGVIEAGVAARAESYLTTQVTR
jgi:hypothetical protein